VKNEISSVVCPVCINCNDRKDRHPSHRGTTTVTDPQSGEIICNNCGMVIAENIQDSARPEWRSFEMEQVYNNRRRIGLPTTLARHDMGLSTIIGRTNKDVNGNEINPALRPQMERLRICDIRTQVAAERRFKRAFDQLNILKSKMGLSNVIVEKAAYIYRKARERGLVRGRDISAFLPAVVYLAYREMGIPRTLNELAIVSNIKRKSVRRCYRTLILELDYKIPIVDITKCIVMIANKASLSQKAKYKAINLMGRVIKKGLSAGKNPMGLAATVLYISCDRADENTSQKAIADAAGITEVTLRNRLQDIKIQLHLN
jgi:transcription initiation factor TFIIB